MHFPPTRGDLMININEIRDAVIAMHQLSNVGELYTLHYDETSNNRLLRIGENGLNVSRPELFVLVSVVRDFGTVGCLN